MNGWRSADGVTHHAGMRKENLLSALRFRVGGIASRLHLVLLPLRKLLRRFGNDAESHMRVLQAAKFGALSSINSGLIHLKPESRGIAG